MDTDSHVAQSDTFPDNEPVSQETQDSREKKKPWAGAKQNPSPNNSL